MHTKHEISCVVTRIIRPLSRVSIDILVPLCIRGEPEHFSEQFGRTSHRVMMPLKVRWCITALYIKLRTIALFNNRISGTYNLSQDREFSG